MKEFQEFMGTKGPAAMRRAMINVAAQIAKDATRAAKEKIGIDHPLSGEGFVPDWEPLAESTITRKENEGYDVPAYLYREGDLKDSIGAPIEDKRSGFVVTLMSDSEVMAYQEFGTTDGHVPPRSVIGLTMYQRAPIYAELLGMRLEIAACPPGSDVSDVMMALAGVFERAGRKTTS
jgi:hypothetical protein